MFLLGEWWSDVSFVGGGITLVGTYKDTLMLMSKTEKWEIIIQSMSSELSFGSRISSYLKTEALTFILTTKERSP